MATLEDIADEFFLDEDWIIQFSLNDENGSPMSAVGATLEFRVQKSTVIKEYTVGDGITFTAIASGQGYVLIRPADQDDYVKGEWNYELWVEFADGTSSIQCKGMMTVSDSLKHKFP